MAKLLIQGKSFYYDELDLSYESAKSLDKDIAKENLLSLKDVLDSCNIKFLLMHGTLLGAIREKDFITHDIDIDLCLFDEIALYNSIPLLAAKELCLCRYIEGELYSFIRKDIYIDIYIVSNWHNVFDKFYFKYAGHNYLPKKYIRGVESLSFLGHDFLIPVNPEKILIFWYGKHWNVPIKNLPSKDEPLLFRFLRKYKNLLIK